MACRIKSVSAAVAPLVPRRIDGFAPGVPHRADHGPRNDGSEDDKSDADDAESSDDVSEEISFLEVRGEVHRNLLQGFSKSHYTT